MAATHSKFPIFNGLMHDLNLFMCSLMLSNESFGNVEADELGTLQLLYIYMQVFIKVLVPPKPATTVQKSQQQHQAMYSTVRSNKPN